MHSLIILLSQIQNPSQKYIPFLRVCFKLLDTFTRNHFSSKPFWIEKFSCKSGEGQQPFQFGFHHFLVWFSLPVRCHGLYLFSSSLWATRADPQRVAIRFPLSDLAMWTRSETGQPSCISDHFLRAVAKLGDGFATKPVDQFKQFVRNRRQKSMHQSQVVGIRIKTWSLHPNDG